MKRTTLALGILACGHCAFASSSPDKDRELQKPVCVLPYGQTIDASDIPRQIRPDERWMSKLRDDLPISLVSIPATHDAGTALGVTGWTRCQVLTIAGQLLLGIRGFDIRLRLVHGRLAVFHNEESQKIDFESVMSALTRFLTAHPREFIVMRIREESRQIGSEGSFLQAFQGVMTSKRYHNVFYRSTSRTSIPFTKDVRGKIVILDNYGKLPFAIEYPNPTMSVQDDYDTSDMNKKVAEIETKFHDAETAPDGKVWHVNYTSSSTVTVDQLANAKAVNVKVEQYLQGRRGHLGLVFMNFPGARVIREIIESNRYRH
ncbi:MAG: hypothetical protein P4L46_10220 [Fimbriimonas sp.]|nr:hypothetical protein [Fimbriimonas sp.]